MSVEYKRTNEVEDAMAKIEIKQALMLIDHRGREKEYYKLKKHLDNLESEYQQLLNTYHNLDEPDDYLEDDLQEYDHIIPALRQQLRELKEELEHYNIKLKRNPSLPIGTMTALCLGYLLGKSK